jgi:hypothetical protein
MELPAEAMPAQRLECHAQPLREDGFHGPNPQMPSLASMAEARADVQVPTFSAPFAGNAFLGRPNTNMIAPFRADNLNVHSAPSNA